MKECKKCNIDLDTNSTICPLCNSEIIVNNTTKASYPTLKNIISHNIFRRTIFFIASFISIVIAFLNYLLTPNVKWSIFVIMQIFASYFVFQDILSGRKKVVKLLFLLNIFISFVSVFWDIYTGFRGWSTNYVLPALCITYGIFMLLLRLINYFAFQENSLYIYINICLGFLPMILVYKEIAKVNVLTHLSGVFAILNLLILIIFDGSKVKEDLFKKMHF